MNQPTEQAANMLLSRHDGLSEKVYKKLLLDLYKTRCIPPRELDDETYVIVDENINLAEKNCGIEIYVQCLDA